jgi:hypothetical protein
VSESPQWLFRTWGRDVPLLAALRHPDKIEREDETDHHGAFCYWFATKAERDWFKASIPQGYVVVRSTADPGYDEDGELIEPRAETFADVTLRLPDGRTFSYSHSFGYGYPAHSVEFMYHDGNYACDCNRRLFLERYAGEPLSGEGDPDADLTCGDTVELVSLVVRKVPLE